MKEKEGYGFAECLRVVGVFFAVTSSPMFSPISDRVGKKEFLKVIGGILLRSYFVGFGIILLFH